MNRRNKKAILAAQRRLSHARLNEILRYDPTTGIFVWRVRLAHRNQVGDIAGYDNGKGHWIIGIDNVKYPAHRLAWFYVHGKWPDPEVDHKDLNGTNNSILNLREATRSQNNANRRAYSRSGMKGAYAHPDGGFTSTITIKKKIVYLGYYPSAEQAHAAYCAASQKHQGEFSRSI